VAVDAEFIDKVLPLLLRRIREEEDRRVAGLGFHELAIPDFQPEEHAIMKAHGELGFDRKEAPRNDRHRMPDFWESMRTLFLLFLLLACGSASERPRLAVLTDIGGDPDDQQAMVRLMVYANEFEIELLLASSAGTPGELREPIVRPDLIRNTIRAYGKVLPSGNTPGAGRRWITWRPR
jgi:hypothetical protein